MAANGTSEHRVVSALGKASDASVSHTVTSAPQSATYAGPRARVRDPHVPAPGAAQSALREAIGPVAEGGEQQEATPVEEAATRQAEAAERPPEKDLVQRHRERAVQRLEDLDDQARTEATQSGSVAPAFEFQVGPDARAYRVGYREAPAAEPREPVEHPSDSRPTVDRQ